MKLITHGTLVAITLVLAHPATAQLTRRVEFRGDPASEAATAVKVPNLDALPGTRIVYRPSTQGEKRQDCVSVAHRIAPPPPAEQQAIADRLYARWVAGLQAQGLTVHGPAETAQLKPWSKVSKNVNAAPGLIERPSGRTRIVSAGHLPATAHRKLATGRR